MDAIHCLLSVLLIVADVPGAQPGAQPNAQVDRPNPLFVIGDTVTAGHMEYKASRARWSKQLLSKKGTDLRSENTFLVIDLMVRNHDRVERTVPPFLLIDDSGKSHDIVGVNDKAIGTLNTSDSLKPHQAIRGTVAFDVDRTKKYRLVVYDGLDTATVVLIELNPPNQLTSMPAGKPKADGGNIEEPTTPRPPFIPAGPTWHEVVTFNGKSGKNTETFEIPDNEWRISWNTTGSGIFGIIVYDDKDNYKDSGPIVMGNSEDSTIIRGAGKYHLKISCLNQKYEIVIETKY